MIRLLERVNAWLEGHQHDMWFRVIDRVGGISQTILIVVFALAGAAIAGWALTRGVAGVLFAILVALGAWLFLHYCLGGDDDA